MIAANLPPRDVTISALYSTTPGWTPGTNTIYNLGSVGLLAEESPHYTWGWQAGPAVGLGGYYSSFAFVLDTNSWGTYTYPGGTAGFNGSCTLTCLYHNVQLTVDTSCHWTLTCDSVTFTLTVGLNAPHVILTVGAQSLSGTNYKEELNFTRFSKTAVFTSYIGTIFLPGCKGEPYANANWGDTVSIYGGYSPADPILFDTGTVGLTNCPCYYDLSLITGNDSASVSCADNYTAQILTPNNYPLFCPGCELENGAAYDQVISLRVASTNVTIKSKQPLLGGQLLQTQWTCVTDSGDTFGSNSLASNPPTVLCASTRAISNDVYTVKQCIVHRGPPPQPCFFPPGCFPDGTLSTCQYNAFSVLTWPSTPPCPGIKALQSWHWQHVNKSVYAVAVNSAGSAEAYWANHYWPIDGWEHQGFVTPLQTNVDTAVIYVANNNSAVVLFGTLNSGVYSLWEAISWDRCSSWSAPVQWMDVGRYPRGAASVQDGSQIRCGLLFDSGSSGPAKIQGQYKGRGDTDWGPTIVFLDGSGNPIKVADVTGWGDFTKAAAGNGPWVMHITAQGDTKDSWWTCNDNVNLTWTKQS